MHLVTGGAGFIGSNIVRELNDRGIDDILVVEALSDGENYRNLCDRRIADYMDRDEFRARLRERGLPRAITAVCHQGACSDTMERDGRYMLDNNFTFSKELLHACLDRGVPFVYASSASVYGAGTTFREDPVFERPLNVYGYSKLLFDQYVRKAARGAESTVVGLRYFNVYGPRETHKGRMASMVYQLFRQLESDGVARLFEGTDGYGDGEQRRDFVFVGDVVDVNLHFLERDRAAFGVFNVGAGRSRSFNDVARGLIDRTGVGRIEYKPFPDSLRGKYQSFTEADLTALRRAGYDRPPTELEDGIDACVAEWQAEGAVLGRTVPDRADPPARRPVAAPAQVG